MTAATSFLAGLMLASTLGALFAVLPTEAPGTCRPGYAHSQRLPPERYYPIAQEAYRRAGIPWHDRDAYRVDHIVPLCLGGSWDQDNLQIQTIEAAAAKDRIEVATCRAYCAGEVTLKDAISRFSRDSTTGVSRSR